MIGSSKFALRIFDVYGKYTIRQMLGVEVLRCIGWDMDDWKCDPYAADFHPDSLLRNLGGNAFSGFAVTPLIASFSLVQGMSLEMDNAKEQVPVGATEHGDVSDSSSGGYSSPDSSDPD